PKRCSSLWVMLSSQTPFYQRFGALFIFSKSGTFEIQDKLYRKIRTVIKSKGMTKDGRKLSCRNLYTIYSIKGAFLGKSHEDGNFLTYVKRAERVFRNEPA